MSAVSASSSRLWVVKAGLYLVGLFLVALGISFSIRSDLGISPLNALPYVLSEVWEKEMGIIVMVVFSLYVVLQICILRKKFRPINLLQFLVSVIFGLFVGMCNELLFFLKPVNYFWQLAFMAASILIMGFGITLYLASGIVPLSAEGLVQSLQETTGIAFHRLKLCFDCLLVLLAVTAGFLSEKGIIGVREGTFIAALCLGPTIGLFMRLIGRRLKKWCSPRTPA